MKKILFLTILFSASLLCIHANAQSKTGKSTPKYDTIIRLHKTKSVKKAPTKPIPKPALVLPVPEYINQPYYYDNSSNRLIKLENATALMVTKKKTLGLKGAKQFLSMDAPSSKIRFTVKKDIVFFIKTSGDVIDLTY